MCLPLLHHKSPGKTKYESQIPLSSWNEQQPRTVRPVGGQPAGSFTQHTDKFVVDDDDMDSDTATESNLSLKSRSFLHRVNDRLRKMLFPSPEDSMQDIDKSSLIWGMFMNSTLEASVFMGKNYSNIFHSIKNTGENLKLTGKILHGNNYLWSMMKKSSVSRMQRFAYFQILCCVLER